MKKNSRLKSFFAILLAVSMIFQQSSLTVLATDDTYVEDATATPTPSESEAEAYATEGTEPVAEKQEEPQQMQETPAAEQAQEPTEAPAEQPTEAPTEQPTEAPAEQPTEAPAEQPTEAPAAAPTETPATEPTAAPAAEVTEAPAAPEATATPAAEATATPTPEVSASPSETPTPTEAPKTSFRYEDSRVVITATAPEDANLQQDAEIKADYIAPGTDRYNAAVAAFNSQLSSQLGLDAENTEAEYVLYDVYFLTADGSRIEPESGNVKVDMSFKKIQESTVDGDVVNKNVVHLDNDGQAEVVTEYVNTNADGEITSMGFTQDSFSIVGGVTTYDVETSGGEGNSENALKLDAYITNVIIQDANQQTITSLTETTTESKRTESFNLVGYFGNIPVDELEKHGWKVEYQIPEQDKIKLEEPTSGTIKNGSNEVIGNYRITTDGFVSMEFDKDKLGHGTAVGGNFTCWAYLDCTDITTTGDVTLKFNDKVENNVTIRVIKKEQLEIKKVAEVPVVNYENNEITYTYTVKVSSPTGTVKSIDFVDKLEKWSSDANLSWSSLTIECNDPLVSVASDCLTISTENKTISGTLPCLSVGEFYTITYKITEKFNEPVNGKFSENNTAKAKTNPSGKLEDLIEVEAKSNPEVNYTSKDYKDVVVDKKGTGVQGDDGKITWTYTVTVSSPHGTGDEIDFKDQLKSDAKGTSRKVKSDSLSVKKKTNTAPDGINVTSENYLKVSGDELLKADSIAVSGKLPALNAGESYEITYQVEESGFTESNFTANGKNTAYAKVTEKVKDEHSSEPTIYYGIPNLNKNGNYDAENNKVNWTIEVNNNFASLEGYEVSDILLQNDIQQNADIIAKVTIQKTGWLDVKLVDDVKLPIKFYTDSNGKPCMEDAAGKVTELYTIRDFIKIEYSTMVPDDNNYYVKYNNTANIEKGGENKGESKKDVDAIKPIVTKDDAIVTENKDSDAVNLAWTTSITIPADGIKVGSYFEDYLENPWSGSEPKLGSWFTKEQLDSMTVTGINKSDYIITYIQTENNANYFKGFKITFNKAISYSEVKQISLSYSSTGYVGNLKAGEKKEFVNEAKFTQDGKQTTDKGKGLYSKESTGPKVDKENLTEDGSVKDAFYSCDNSKKIRIYYRVVIDTESLTENIVYEDVFPNYGTLVTSDWKYDGKECDSNNSRKGIIVRYLSDTTEADNLRGVFGNLGFDYYAASRMDVTESKTGSFTITVDKDAIGIHSNGNWFAPYGERPKLVLYYAIDYDLNSVGLTDRNDCVITNNGTVSSGGKSDSSSATATVEMSKVSKSSAGYHDDTNTISYAVTINPAGEEVLDGNNLTVTDTLNYTDHVNDIKGISLIPGSAKLYRRNADGSKGEDITPNGGWISVTDANGICTLVASVPDKTACILEYKYLFEYKNISRKDYLISNTAVVSGEANKKWTSTVSTQLKDQGSDVIANTESTMLTLVKRDSQNAALFLEGAVYKLEKYNGTKWVTVGENYTTDKNGVVQLGEEINGKIVMKYNYAYRLTEIKAPNNYKCASEPIYIYLKEASSSVSYKPTGFDESKALGSNGGYIYVSDEKDLTEKISIPVEKRWDDANNKEGFRPSKITVVLIKNGTETKTTLELTADNDWKGEFSKLDKFDSAGDLISYGIKEIEVNYYPKPDVTGDATKGFVVTNKRTPEMVDISVSKSWDDSNNQDGKRVGEVEVQLYADGSAVAGKVLKLNEGNGWKGTFQDLDKYKKGQEIKYTVVETTNVDGYTASVSGNAENGYVITNKYTPDKVNIPVSKSWDDSNNQDGKRVGEVEVQLYADGSAVAGKVLKLNEGNGWKGTFQDLDKYKKGQEIKYTVVETTNVDGYTASVSGNAENGYVITNKYTPDKVNIPVSKSWDDSNNQDGKRVGEVEVQLYADGSAVAGKVLKLNEGNGWKGTFQDLDKYKKGQEIKYTVVETTNVDGYTASVSGNAENGYVITNKYTPDKVNIPVSKSWDDSNNQDGKRVGEVEVQLYADGSAVAGKVLKLNEGNGWKGTFQDLDKYKKGQEIKYTVVETTNVNGYTANVSGSAKDGYVITNIHTPESVNIEGTKTWNDNGNADIRPETITINLYANKKLVASKTVTKTDDWKWKFADQPKYEKGQEIEYTITEDKVDGYITAQGIGNYDVVNTPTTVTVDKVDDEGNPVKNAKLQISVKDDNGNVVASWKTDDTSYDIIGKLIAGNTYTLEEINVPTGYVAADPITFKVEADGTITVDNKTIVGNKLTLVDAKLHFNVNKVELGNGKEVEGAHLVVIDKETGKTVDEWVSEKGKTHDFGPKLEAGKSYILRETVAPAGYKYATDIEFTVKKDGTIETNAKTTTDTDGNKVYLVEDDTTKVTITKVDALGNQLSGVVLEIQDKDGVVIDSWTTSTKDNPRVITGKLILGETYKLVEKSAPAGYTLADPVEFTVSENDIDNKVEMKNTYSASGSLNLTAKKTLTTTETPLTEGQFTFELRDKDGTVLQTKTNDADGNVTFDEIKYSLVKDNTDKKVDDTGEYQYTVNEVKGDAAGYTYDDTIYTINATVTDAGNGTLTVTPVIHSSKATSEDATVTGMEFTNTYTTSGQIALGATKTLEGQTLEAEQFSFQATEMDADGKAVENGYNETVKNADGGTITFPIITYKESGTHYYQITEVKDEKPAYQYDERKYVVKVDVTDDNAGKLTAKVTSVTKNGEPVKSEDLTGAVTFTNTYSASADLELKAQKSMKVEAEQLGTFEFELKDADGKVIETVKNDEKGAISFSKLSYTEKDAGKTFTYTVNEKLPSEADTYVYDKTVYTVTVNVEDNRDGTLKLTTKVNGEDYTETAMKFVNDTTKVTISKVDDTTLKALAGAKLQVVDDQDKVVEEWTSDGTPHVITAKLVLGKTYKLVEAEAPSGYEIAEPITFTVDADDTKNAVEMKDAMTKGKTAAIEITKELKLNDALAGAKDMTFYAALFADAECTIPASDVKALEFKNASSSTVTFTNLDLGRTYYVSETDVTGKAIDSGMTPDEKVYVPVYPQGQAITVTEDGAKSSITFENQFSEWPDGFYKIATLNVTKKLLGADGNALESDEIFYAGIFDDKECTTLSTRTEKNILTLDLAGGSTVSESTQAVVIPDESFTLYVAETDAEGNLVGGTDGFRYAVTVENGNVLFDENNLNAEVTIINQKQPEATPTVTPEETITPTPTPGTSTGVKTGDDTPIGFYMALFFVAALAIEETTRRRRKKEQD